MLTLEERERRAYVEGRVEEAALLAQAIETENDALDEMRDERDSAQREVEDLGKQNDELQEVVEVTEEKVLTLTSDLENAQDEIKALQVRIHEAGVDLV